MTSRDVKEAKLQEMALPPGFLPPSTSSLDDTLERGELLSLPEGDFRIFLEKSENRQMRRRWVFAAASPGGENLRGSARTRFGADHQIRKFVALEISKIRRRNKKRKKQAGLVQTLRRSGFSEYDAQQMAERQQIICREIAPGQVLCSWHSNSGWDGRGWHTEIYADGERVTKSEARRTRRRSRRQAEESLQEFYEKRFFGV